MPTADDLGRIVAFLAAFARRQAATVVEVPGGAVVLDPAYAGSHVDNQLVIDATAAALTDGAFDPAELPLLAEDVLGGLAHRRITVLDDAVGRACAPALTAAGYEQEVELLMAYTGPPVPAPVPAAEAVTLAELRPALLPQLRVWMPQAPTAVLEQLADRRTARLRGADQVRFLAVRDQEGTIGASADLYVDGRGTAQIEEIVTADTHTRRGYADTILATALHRTAGCSLVFLVADPDDWPHTWYARRGFTAVGRSHVFSRTPSAAAAEPSSGPGRVASV